MASNHPHFTTNTPRDKLATPEFPRFDGASFNNTTQPLPAQGLSENMAVSAGERHRKIAMLNPGSLSAINPLTLLFLVDTSAFAREYAKTQPLIASNGYIQDDRDDFEYQQSSAVVNSSGKPILLFAFG